jgi:hypothetical protein
MSPADRRFLVGSKKFEIHTWIYVVRTLKLRQHSLRVEGIKNCIGIKKDEMGEGVSKMVKKVLT